MKKLLILLLPCCLFFTSCSNDDEAEASFDLACTYLEVQEGTKFTYKQESFGGIEQTINTEVTSQETVDGVLVVVAESNGNESYLSCEGDKFIQSAPSQTQTNGTVTNTTGDILMTLDFGMPVGDSTVVATIVVTSEVQGEIFTTTNSYFGKVLETGISKDVEGTTYDDVIKYELKIYSESSQIPGQQFLSATTIYYIAPKVATILAEVFDSFSGTVLSTTTLVDYEY